MSWSMALGRIRFQVTILDKLPVDCVTDFWIDPPKQEAQQAQPEDFE